MTPGERSWTTSHPEKAAKFRRCRGLVVGLFQIEKDRLDRARIGCAGSVSVTARVVRGKQGDAISSSSGPRFRRGPTAATSPPRARRLEKLPVRAVRANSLSALSRSFIGRLALTGRREGSGGMAGVSL